MRAATGTSGLACTDTSFDPANCGACGTVCAPQQACGAGKCTDCPSGQLQCPTPKSAGHTQCTPILSDDTNCGGCGVKCAAGSSCQNGACIAAGLSNCGNASGGPAVQKDLQNDPQNCGACGNACAANEVCKAGDCDPCPVAACSNVCVDTQHDPANCGICGHVVPSCENGVSLAKISIELLAPLSITPASSFVTAPASSMPFSVRVHSTLRVVSVTVKTAVDIASLGAATATQMTLGTPADVSPSGWGGTIPVPASGTTVAIEIDAYDEEYLPSLGAGGANPSHTDQKQFTATIKALPSATVTNVTAALGPTAVGSGAACSGKPCMWVPLNAGQMTLSAQVVGAPANGVASIEFHNANVTGPDPSLLCPSKAPAAAGTAAPPCAQPVNSSGVATLTLNAAEVGKGDVTIWACPLDVTGLQYGTCVQMPLLTNACGAAGTGACPANFTIGRVATCPTFATCPQPVPPAVGRNADTPANHSVYYLNTTGAAATTAFLFAQDAQSLHFNGNDQPGAQVGANTYFPDGLLATAEGSGVFAVRCTGTCSSAPAGNNSIDRIDCTNTGSATCYKQNFVTATGVRQIHVATSQAMLISNALPPASTTGGTAFFANALQAQTTAAAVAVGGTLQAVSTINGATNSSGVNWGTTTSGAIVAWFNIAGNISPVIYHPNLPGNHFVTLPSVAGATAAALDLTVFPTGEIVYQASSATTRYVSAAYYDGTATLPKTLGFVTLGALGTTGIAKNFITAGTGILLGEEPVAGSTTNFQAVQINLFAGSGTPAGISVLIPFDGITTGTVHTNGVFARKGSAATFAVSDDLKKAIFVTDDPPVPGQTATIFRLHLADLATGSQTSLAGSERMLCALTATTGVTAGCTPIGSGSLHYPRFVHSAPPYVGAAPAGIHQVVIWEEEEPIASSSAITRHARVSFANFSGSGAPAPGTIDRLVTYFRGPFNAPTEVESAAAGSIFFLADNALGGADLFAVPLTAPTSSPVTSTRVLDNVNGFRVREETTPARLLVNRADGVLFFAPLAGGGANPASALVPIGQNGTLGTLSYTVVPTDYAFGFTPDGNHAFRVVDQQAIHSTTTGFNIVWGVLETVDLGTFARTNWGRIAFNVVRPITAGFLANATTAEIEDVASVENFSVGRLTVALAANATSHADTGVFAGDPSTTAVFNFSTTLDGSEALAGGLGGGANSLAKDGTLLAFPGFAEPLAQLATNSPFGGPYRPEYSQLDDSAVFNGASGSFFKVWGTTAPASAPPPFVTLSRGYTAAASSVPAQTRQTPDNKELEYSFVDSGDTGGAYAIWLPLSGRAPPPPLRP